MNLDYIKITGLEVFAHHGVLPEEKEKGQTFLVNGKFYYDMKPAGRTDQLEKALNYAELSQTIAACLQEKAFDLIEAAADYLSRTLLLQYPLLDSLELELCKPQAPIGLPFENVSVNLKRGWHRAYLAVGSNLGDSRGLIDAAVEKLKGCPDMKEVRLSDLLHTKPYGLTDQPVFLNGALALKTLLDPEELLEMLHELEAEADRTREIHWGPRTLDLDILLYDDLVYESHDLIIPHVDMENRSFVLKPMVELAPNLRHPVLKQTMTQLFLALPKKKRMVLFDVDGTLVDSSEGITKSTAYALDHFGIEVDRLQDLLCFIGPPLRGSFVKYYGFSREQADQATRIFRERYNRVGLKESHLYPGVKECLGNLKECGYSLGVASSKPEKTCHEILNYLGVEDCFDIICGATEDGRINTKEDVIKDLFVRNPELSKEDYILIGDTVFDVEGAVKCGLGAVGVSFGFGDTEEMKAAGALAIADAMDEIPGILEEKFPLL